jgi:hypothetical protein
MSHIDPLMKKVITDVMTNYNDPSLIQCVTDPASFAHGFNCGVEKAKQERNAAVAELVEQSKLAATKLMRAYLDCSDLVKAIEAVEATQQ